MILCRLSLLLLFLAFVSGEISNFEKVLKGKRIQQVEIDENLQPELFEQKAYEQRLDHFNFENQRTFSQRYFVNASFWRGPGDPIVFYPGNEGKLELFWAASGFLTKTLPRELNAAVVFAEHRYFGKSFPDVPNVKRPNGEPMRDFSWLSIEQVMEDYADLLLFLRKSEFGDSPVIACGGSYGGMLAAWMRMRYPNLVLGALSASGPVVQFWKDSAVYWKIITKDLHLSGQSNCQDEDKTCDGIFRTAMFGIEHVARLVEAHSEQNLTCDSQQPCQPQVALNALSNNLNLCKPLDSAKSVRGVADWFQGKLGNLAMVNYPYAANFLGDFPPWPMDAMCSAVCTATSTDDNASKMVPLSNKMSEEDQVASIYPGADPGSGCSLTPALLEQLSVTWKGVAAGLARLRMMKPKGCLDLGPSSDDPLDDLEPWDYLTCTSQVFAIDTNGVTDIFPSVPFNASAYSSRCLETYNVKPDFLWPDRFSGDQWTDCSNIIFSNGNLDCWGKGSFLEAPSAKCYSVNIDHAAHHYDLRAPHPEDTAEVIAARSQEQKIMEMWLAEWRATKIVATHSREELISESNVVQNEVRSFTAIQ